MVSLSIWVQFLRNAACVIRALIPTNHFLLQEINILHQNVIIINIFISCTQFYAMFASIYNGFVHIYQSIKKLHQMYRFQYDCDICMITKPSIETSILQMTISKEIHHVFYYEYLVGYFEVIFGICFFYLGTNSLNIHFAHHPKQVIDALYIMEIFLVYFLYFMYITFQTHYHNVQKAKRLIRSLESLQKINIEDILLKMCQVGFWKDNIQQLFKILDLPYHLDYEKDATSEVGRLGYDIHSCFIQKNGKDKVISSKASKVLGIHHVIAIQQNLEKYIQKERYQGHFDLIIFVLNVIAFYGYLCGVYVFYYPQPDLIWLQWMFGGLSHEMADWWGNFLGDLAWTIEPLLFIIPFLLSKNVLGKQLQQSLEKEKNE